MTSRLAVFEFSAPIRQNRSRVLTKTMNRSFTSVGGLRKGAAVQRAMGSAAAGVHVLRRHRAPGLRFALAADLLCSQHERQRDLSAAVWARLRGVTGTLAQEDRGSAVRAGLLRDRLRQALLPRYTALRNTGNDTENTNVTGTTAASCDLRSAAVLAGDAGGDGQQRQYRQAHYPA